MSPDFQEGFLREQIADYETLLTDMKAGEDADSKRLIKRIEKQKEQLGRAAGGTASQDRKDDGLTFEN